jgi:hypothetical protein
VGEWVGECARHGRLLRYIVIVCRDIRQRVLTLFLLRTHCCNKVWEQRWFHLSLQTKQLAYYSDRKATALRGAIPITNICAVVSADSLPVGTVRVSVLRSLLLIFFLCIFLYVCLCRTCLCLLLSCHSALYTFSIASPFSIGISSIIPLVGEYANPR